MLGNGHLEQQPAQTLQRRPGGLKRLKQYLVRWLKTLIGRCGPRQRMLAQDHQQEADAPGTAGHIRGWDCLLPFTRRLKKLRDLQMNLSRSRMIGPGNP